MSHPIEDLMSTTMQKIREMVDANTIVGTPISTADGITLIPISKLSFGFGSGGSDMKGKTSGDQQLFGGGGGAGVMLSPVAFIVISNGSARILSIAPPRTRLPTASSILFRRLWTGLKTILTSEKKKSFKFTPPNKFGGGPQKPLIVFFTTIGRLGGHVPPRGPKQIMICWEWAW